MNSKILYFIKGLSVVLISNFVSMLASALGIIIIPHVLNIDEYGKLQLYLFYTSYVGLLHFGWNDGIYLRYGGESYNKLDKKKFFSQFWMLVILQLFFLLLIVLGVTIGTASKDLRFVGYMSAICMLFTNCRFMPLYILQATGKVKEYATILIINKISYILMVLLGVALRVSNYQVYIFVDLLGLIFSFIYTCYCCKDIIIKNIRQFEIDLSEAYNNINVGIKLMFSNFSSQLIVGCIKFAIEKKWDIGTFGKVSLVMNISNMIMIFINAVGLIIYPILKKIPNSRLSTIYISMREILEVLLYASLFLSYPIKIILEYILPYEYRQSLNYMILLFPICLYEGKTSLLLSTYYKIMRKEKQMLKWNLITLFISVVSTIITAFILENLNYTISLIIILIAIRCILFESYIASQLLVPYIRNFTTMIIITLLYISFNAFYQGTISLILYLITYMLYFWTRKNNVKKSLQILLDV